MKSVEKWKWRIRWGGRWTTTRITYTEADIGRQHPEATRIEATRVLVELPETEAEVAIGQRPPNGANQAAAFKAGRVALAKLTTRDHGR